MADEIRGDEPLLSDASLEMLASLPFFQLVDFLQKKWPDAGAIGSTHKPSLDRVRFRANATLGFPASEISSVERNEDRALEGVDVTLNLIGLHGPSSPLPTSYTERIIHSEGSNALGDFFDFFNHRFASLLYVVWKHYQHHVRYDHGGADPISMAVGALFGLLPQDEVVDFEERPRLLPFVGLLGMASHSASSVSSVLSSYFKLPFQIEECVYRWIEIPDNQRFALGKTGFELGCDSILGESMPDTFGKFRIWCGPIDFLDYKALLPNRERHTQLQRLVNFAVQDPLARDFGFILDSGSVSPWSLGACELGWTTWIDPSSDQPITVVI